MEFEDAFKAKQRLQLMVTDSGWCEVFKT